MMVGITVKTYQPDIRVTLYKTRSRTNLNSSTQVSSRYPQVGAKIDLTPFLSESSGVRTSKSTRDPAGGFSITLADKPFIDSETFESLYGVIEPMDFVEIRVRRGAFVPSSEAYRKGAPTGLGDNPTIPNVLMRGFVSDIQRNETMGADGRPQRSVVISGQDYGKLWQMLQILYLPGYVIGQDILSQFKLFERFGTGFQTSLKASDFVSQMIDNVINPYLSGLMPPNSPNPTRIQKDITVGHGTTSITGPQNQQGTVYSLLSTFGDVGIWNELYLEDREAGVFCVYRPNPAVDIDGNKIQADAPDPVYVNLPDTDVISLSVSRSDSNVANFYWVRSPRFDLVNDSYRQLFAVQGADSSTVLLGDYPNSLTKLYGTRVMYGETQQGGDTMTNHSSGLPENQSIQQGTDAANWMANRRQIMVDQNKDNVLLERGVIRIHGNEMIKAGYYVTLTRGDFSADYYVTQVDHDYVPFSGFFSTLSVERGTGFVKRTQRSGGPDSPYLSELVKK